MASEGFWDDPERAKVKVSNLKESKSIVDTLDVLAKGIDDVDVLGPLADETGDREGQAEVLRIVAEMRQNFADLELRTLLSGPFDAGGAVVTIQSGAGGTDASDWAMMLLRLYSRWAENHGFSTGLLEVSEHEEAGIKHATLQVTGAYAYGYLSAERGVHRLVRISPFDAQGRRQTSFAALDVMPEVEEDVDIEINDKDLRIDTYRAGGKGGQHVNKTESAVRITHLPTNSVVQCQSERSQFKNKDRAMKMLKAKLLQLREEARNKETQSMYDSKGEIAWGSQIRSYVLAPYTLVKDHRTNFDVGNVQAVLDGDVDPFIQAYLKHKASGK